MFFEIVVALNSQDSIISVEILQVPFMVIARIGFTQTDCSNGDVHNWKVGPVRRQGQAIYLFTYMYICICKYIFLYELHLY